MPKAQEISFLELVNLNSPPPPPKKKKISNAQNCLYIKSL